jgi:flagellin-specific chaperone FliS
MHGPHLAYRRHSVSGWTRIDLLVSLYEAALRSLAAGAAKFRRQPPADASLERLKLLKQLLALLEGLAPEPGNLAEQIRSLLLFCVDRVALDSAEAWDDAARILTELHAGFTGIQAEARELELQGLLPPIDARPVDPVLA